MTEKKKRGLLSWLGFGDEEQTQAESRKSAQQQEAQPVESPAQETQSDAEVSPEPRESANEPVSEADVAPEVDATPEVVAPRVVEQEKPTESFFARLKRSLARTKANIGAGFFGLFKGKQIDDELFEELETQLLITKELLSFSLFW